MYTILYIHIHIQLKKNPKGHEFMSVRGKEWYVGGTREKKGKKKMM